MGVRIADGSSPRPVSTLVTAGEFVIHSDVLGRLRGGAEAVAEALEHALQDCARAVGQWPETVQVRHDDVALALAPLLEPRGVVVEAAETPHLVEAARSLLESMSSGPVMWPPPCGVESWRAWDLPPSLTADIFAAAAAYYRRAPWKDAANFQAPRALLPSGREWTCGILGNADEQYGLVLYSNPGDLFELLGRRDERYGLEGMAGRLLNITFERLVELPPAVRREVQTQRWELAGPAAYPLLLTINTPGGGVSTTDAEDLILLLRSLPAWVAAHRAPLLEEDRTGEPMAAVRWTEPETGVVFSYAGEGAGLEDGALYDDDFDDDDFDDYDGPGGLQPELPPELRRVLDDVIAAAFAELGDDVDGDTLTREVSRRLEQAMVAVNREPQADMGGLSPEQVNALISADWYDADSVVELNPALGVDDVAHAPILANVRTLLAIGMERGGLAATQAGNLKPALVEELLDRLTFVDAEMADLSREWSANIREHDYTELRRTRWVCELAGLLHRRSTRFDITVEGARLAHDDAAGELFLLLFATWLHDLDMDQSNRFTWPELQVQLMYTLFRLPEAAAQWRTAEELLADVVLPFALERAPGQRHAIMLAAIVLESNLLNVLAGFGLLERRASGDPAPGPRVVHFRTTPLLAKFVAWDDALTTTA